MDNGNSFKLHDRISAAGSHPQIVSLDNSGLLIALDEPVMVNNQYFKRVAVQKRTANGISEKQNFITADTITSSYPVLASVNEQKSVVAYIVQKEKKNFIMYHQIEL